MLLAVIADLHANLAALEAVFNTIKKIKPDLTICLGDIVGYSAEPSETIALVQEITSHVISGNHDFDVVKGVASSGTNVEAQIVQRWTMEKLSSSEMSYLSNLPNKIIYQESFVAVHGCYLNDTHINGYVTGSMLENNLRALLKRPSWPTLAFCGHTHVPLAGWLENEICWEDNLKETIYWPKTANAVLINPGSVGQPRDDNPKASFALVDTEKRKIQIVRVEYAIEKTIAAITKAGLPNKFAERLLEGR